MAVLCSVSRSVALVPLQHGDTTINGMDFHCTGLVYLTLGTEGGAAQAKPPLPAAWHGRCVYDDTQRLLMLDFGAQGEVGKQSCATKHASALGLVTVKCMLMRAAFHAQPVVKLCL